VINIKMDAWYVFCKGLVHITNFFRMHSWRFLALIRAAMS
jgi:hypothetical protein